MLRAIRIVVGFLALVGALVAGVIAFTDHSHPDFSAARAAALADYEANGTRTSGAPQQQVVNGWVAKDLAIIQSDQLDESLRMQRFQTAMLVVIAGLLAFAVLTQPDRTDEFLKEAQIMAELDAAEADALDDDDDDDVDPSIIRTRPPQ